jgi:hypothetical protein
MARGCLGAAALSVSIVSAACGGGNTGPQGGENAPGSDRTGKTSALETGASLLQAKPPVDKIAMYLDGFHVTKGDTSMQMEAHHYCNQVNEEFAQCVLFDGNTGDARMMGIEYIIAETLYNTLPPEEKAYWHPHNYEVLSGTLRMPGLPDAAEKAALETKINSYGKTWHTWMTGVHGRKADPLPFGPPHLQWSFNRDGEARPEMVQSRDQRMGLDSAKARQDRQDLVTLARPQGGVDAMAGLFPNTKAIPGVADNGDAATRPVPTFGMKAAAARRVGQ